MKIVHFLALVAVAILALFIGYFAGTQTKESPVADMVASVVSPDQQGTASSEPDSTVLATVNGEKITDHDVETLYNSLPQQYRQAPFTLLKPQLVDQLVSMQVIEQAAEAEKYGEQADFEDRLAAVRSQLIQEYYLKKKIDELVTDDMVKAEYDKITADFKPEEEVHARHILLKTEQEAEDVIKLLNEGGDFTALAKEYSTGPSGPQGGDLGYFTKERMVPEFAEVAFKMDKGDYSKTPVKTQFGYHVIKVEDKRQTQPPSLEEKQAEIQGQLTSAAVEKLVNDLKATAEIVILEPAKNEKADEKDMKEDSKSESTETPASNEQPATDAPKATETPDSTKKD